MGNQNSVVTKTNSSDKNIIPSLEDIKNEFECIEEIKNGSKKYTYANGDTYDGEWKDDKRHGRGKFITSSFKYDGQWETDKRHGTGVLIEANGDMYSGEFANDYMHGNGIMAYETGDR